MISKTRIALLAALVAAVAAVPALALDAAGSALPGGNLIVNPGAEAAPGARNYDVVPLPGWQVSPGFTAYQYLPKALDLPSADDGAKLGGGTNFFIGGGHNAPTASASQVVDVSAASGVIDAGAVVARLSALIGGSRAQEDHGIVDATFLDQAGTSLGKVAIGPVTAEQRKRVSKLLPQAKAGAVPVGTRSVRVTMTAVRIHGSYNEAIFDNLSLVLAEPKQLATLGSTCRGKSLVLVVKPAAGLKVAKVVLGAGGARSEATSAPYTMGVALGKSVKKVAATAVVTDASGRATTVRKTVKACR